MKKSSLKNYSDRINPIASIILIILSSGMFIIALISGPKDKTFSDLIARYFYILLFPLSIFLTFFISKKQKWPHLVMFVIYLIAAIYFFRGTLIYTSYFIDLPISLISLLFAISFAYRFFNSQTNSSR